MASNPLPFPVEDNTDEDFFDKLVNDEDYVDFGGTSSLGHNFVDGNESDETKAFSNLHVNELDSNCDVSFDDSSSNLDTGIRSDEHIDDACVVEDSGNSLTLTNSIECHSPVFDPKNEDEMAKISSATTTFVSKSSGGNGLDMTVVGQNSSGSGVPGVKEMDWSAFHSDANKNDDNTVVTDSDFFSELGGDSAGDAWGNVGDGLDNGSKALVAGEVHGSTYTDSSNYELFNNVDNRNYEQFNGGNNHNVIANQATDVQDLNSSQYWESMYPGWKYDPASEQWYQIDNYNSGASEQENLNSNLSSSWGMPDEKTEVSYLQQTAQSVGGTVAESGRIESVTDWNLTPGESDATTAITNWNQGIQASSDSTVILNQASQDSSIYPPHMVFDPQYPGWYYDTIAQEWYSLESYMVSTQSTTEVHNQINQDGYALQNTYTQNIDQQPYSIQGRDNSHTNQTLISQNQNQNWTGSSGNYNQQGSKMWRSEAISGVESTLQYGGIPQINSHHGQNFSTSSQGSQQNSVYHGVAGSYHSNISQGQNEFYMPSSSQGLFVGGNISQQFNNLSINQHDEKIVPNEYYSNQSSATISQQIQDSQVSYTPAARRTLTGRPPHALVAFGFGGKLILMKENSFTESVDFGRSNSVRAFISVLDMAEVVSVNSTSNQGRSCIYFNSLSRQAAPGPLTGGSVGTKELNKWIDDRISNPESSVMDYQNAEGFKLLLALLKMGCQYYGKFRSPYGSDAALKENDGPESAVGKIFSSGTRNDNQFNQYGVVGQCLQQMPSDRQMQVTADEVQNLLISGRKKEALLLAQEGQLWGPALVLAAQLGDQFYVETVRQMALRQLVAGTPLRTLCLLIAGQPADVFSADNTATSNIAGATKLSQPLPQFGANCLLDDWKENLAVITANRTKDDELVLIHMGDCLWKERSDVIAAHICYLVAEANFEPYSDSGSARLCLVGADHLKFPRTYASPAAIQITEIYEYAKTLGNSQFVLLPFQPYKFVYANMLAEVGRTSDSLKYCQVVLKSLKTGRSPEAEMLRQLVSSLEERIKTHQEGGFSANLAPKKLVGKLLNLFDSTAHRVVGALPPPVPTSGGMNVHQSLGQRVATSQSTMAMSSLVPSQSTEPTSEWTADNNRMSLHARSASEPDFGRSPRQIMKEASSTGEQDKGPTVSRRSRFGSFGFGSQLLQKTVGLVLSSHQGRQAKLGDTNKFYYDEKLKRWVEEGAAQPAEEEVLPPPPTTAVLQNGTSDYNLKDALQNEISHANRSPENGSPNPMDNNSGIPPLPPTSNQYSARGRMGVRSRYVDTFNQGGGNSVNLFQSPSLPSIKPASGPNPKFFVPTPSSFVDQPDDTLVNNMQDTPTHEYPSTSQSNDSFQTPVNPSSANMQRFASMDNLSKNSKHGTASFSASSRRTASWSGSLSNSFHPSHTADVRPPGEVLGRRPSPLKPNEPSLAYSSSNGGSLGDDLHEVEL